MRVLSIAVAAAIMLATPIVVSSNAQPSEIPPGTIAYTNGSEIRLIESDGTEDRLVWEVPGPDFSVSRLTWRPDGAEIGFASNHYMATSHYERDLFAIQPDGRGLRKLTNPPLLNQLASFPKGTVEVTVANYSGEGGSFFVYVMGAAEPQQAIINPGAIQTLVFDDVADFGDDVFQHAVVISGIFRWWDAAVAADVEAGGMVDAGTINMTSAYEHYGADGPFWRSDASRVGYFQTAGFAGTATCIIEQIPDPPPLGFYADDVFAPDLFETPCAAEWAPIPAFADELLVTDYTDFVSDGLVHVYRVPEGSTEKGDPLVTFDGYVQIYDIRWLPDAGGFLLSKHDGLLERGVNLYEYRFSDGEITKLTDFSGEEEGVRSFSISPDGEYVVFEYVMAEDEAVGDAWIMRRDGTEPHLLVEEAGSPVWAIMAPNVGVERPSQGDVRTGRVSVFPHPVTTGSAISYRVPEAQEITLKLYDALGREVMARPLGAKLPGEHGERLDTVGLAAGVYLIRLTGSAGARQVGKSAGGGMIDHDFLSA